MSGTILWDVDTQVDFIEPGGKLYFEGAEDARPAMARLVEAARAAGVVHVASCDQHELSDPEISEEPDFDSTWPPHCLLGTRGAEKIPETKQLDPLALPLVPVPPGILRRLLGGGREVLIPKKQYDPFTNPNTETILHDSRGGGCVTRLRDASLAADEKLRWWRTGSIGWPISPRPGCRSRSSSSSR